MDAMTLPQIAERTGRSLQMLRRHAAAGILRAEKRGSVWLVDSAELARYLALPPRKGGRPRRKGTTA